MDEHMMVAEIAALKNEIETLTGMVKAERAKVIEYITEFVLNNTATTYNIDEPCICTLDSNKLLEKLDSMEDETNV